ncbi:hypothetical protein D3C85_1481280 [compost metagenome]
MIAALLSRCIHLPFSHAVQRVILIGDGLIVVDSDEIRLTPAEQLYIPLLKDRREPLLFQIPQWNLRIVSQAVHIQPPEIGEFLRVLKSQHILRLT